MRSLLIYFLFIITASSTSFGEINSAQLVGKFNDLFAQDSGCTYYHTGCMRLKGSVWRTRWNDSFCKQSCDNPCAKGKEVNENAKQKNFDRIQCEKDCVERKPIAQLLKKHSGKKPICIIIHHSGVTAKDLPPTEKEQRSYTDAMSFDEARGDQAQLDSGGKCQWGDVPYHFQVDLYGNLIEGRSTDVQPDTNTRSELDTDGKINIEIDGDYRTVGKEVGKCQTIDHNRLSDKQIKVLRKTIDFLKMKYKTNYVTAHTWLAQTECPGDDVMRKLVVERILTGCPDDKYNPANKGNSILKPECPVPSVLK